MGSEWPRSMLPVFGIPIRGHALLLGLLLDYISDAATLERILVDNPAKLYRLSRRELRGWMTRACDSVAREGR